MSVVVYKKVQTLTSLCLHSATVSICFQRRTWGATCLIVTVNSLVCWKILLAGTQWQSCWHVWVNSTWHTMRPWILSNMRSVLNSSRQRCKRIWFSSHSLTLIISNSLSTTNSKLSWICKSNLRASRKLLTIANHCRLSFLRWRCNRLSFYLRKHQTSYNNL